MHALLMEQVAILFHPLPKRYPFTVWAMSYNVG